MTSGRLPQVRGFFVFLSLVLIARLFYLQVVKYRHYRLIADSQHWQERTISPKRGRIFSQDNFPLVVNKSSYLLYAELPRIKDPGSTARYLSELFFRPDSFSPQEKRKGLGNLKKEMEAGLKEKLRSKKYFWVALFHHLSEDEKVKIQSSGIPGLGFDEEPQRSYPEGGLASFVLGFVGSEENGNDKGYYGLEGFYDGDLKGREGKIIAETGASGEPILNSNYREIKAQDGRDLYLTLNRTVQYLVERRLKDAVGRYKASSGSVIIIDPSSGAVIAMASYPSFLPEDLEGSLKKVESESDDKNLIFKNPAISETYEPGSVVKALTISAAIDNDLVTPQTEYDDDGPLEVDGNIVNNWDKKHLGRMNVIKLLQKSNNIGAAFVGVKVGSERLGNYFRRFGLGSPLGIDLEGEDSGTIKDVSAWRKIDLVTASFGQGVSATPLQIVTAFAAIANGGSLFKPHLVSHILEGERRIDLKPVKINQPLSSAKAGVMVDLLTAAAEGGEGKYFVLKKFRVAGKTGTAQIPEAGHYDPNKSNATFVGFLPNSSKFVMLVKLKEPTTSVYAAETAVPLWMEITTDLVNYYGILPDR